MRIFSTPNLVQHSDGGYLWRVASVDPGVEWAVEVIGSTESGIGANSHIKFIFWTDGDSKNVRLEEVRSWEVDKKPLNVLEYVL